jgi:large subunit ribosomal protein L15
MKLNDLKDNEGSHHRRMRIGRGEGSGKGKTGGRGVKGQKARTGHGFKQFEGGQMPLHMRMPKRGFNNPGALKFAEVNLWRLAKAIEAGRLDAKSPIDAKALMAAGVIRRERDGVRILGHGEISVALTISAYSASASAKAAIEAAGGVLTLSKVETPKEA